MTDTDSSGAQTPLVAFPLYLSQAGGVGVEGSYWRLRLELMVLHLPGSMSIMAVITLSKESISLFSFLLHPPRQKEQKNAKKPPPFPRLVCRFTYIYILLPCT